MYLQKITKFVCGLSLGNFFFNFGILNYACLNTEAYTVWQIFNKIISALFGAVVNSIEGQVIAYTLKVIHTNFWQDQRVMTK